MSGRCGGRWSGLLSFAFLLIAATAAEAQSITLANGASYHQGDSGANAPCPQITISCGGSFWTSTNDMRIIIPNNLNLTWDTSVTAPTFDKSNITVGNVAATVTYESNAFGFKTCVIDITSSFTFGPPPSVLKISGLQFVVGAPGSPNSGNLGAGYNGPLGGTNVTDAVHSLVIYNNPTISSGGSYSISPPGPVVANQITIQEAASSPGILTSSDLRITIPPSLNMTWNTAITNPTFGGVFGKVSNTVSYDNNRTLRINVTSNFASSDVLTISGLQFTNIGGDSSGQLYCTTNFRTAPLSTPTDANGTDGSTITILGLPTISSAAPQIFTKGDPSTAAQDITVTESAGTSKITAANDIRITIPAGFNMTWDASIASAAVSGTARTAGHIAAAPAVSYSNGNRTVFIPVLSTFGASQTAVISGLKFANFTAASAANTLQLDTTNDGVPEDTDNQTIAIGAPTISSGTNQIFGVGDPPTPAATITIVDGSPSRITATNDIRIKIPAGFGMQFDTTRVSTGTGLSFGGTGLAHAAQTVSYVGTTTAVVNINSDFASGQTLTISGLVFQNFSAATPNNLQLEVNGFGTNCNVDNFFIAVGGAPTISSAASQAFTVADPSTLAATITIQDANGVPTITSANGIRLVIPAGFPMEWDTTITSSPAVTFTGSGSGHVAAAPQVSYPDARTALIALKAVGGNFAINEQLIVNGLKFRNFTAAAAAANLALLVDPLGSPVPDDKTIGVGRPTLAIAANQTFGVGDGSTILNTLTVTEDTSVPRIKATSGIQITIPAGLAMVFDPSVTDASQVTIAGSGSGHIPASGTILSYPVGNKTAVLAVQSDFGAGEAITIAGLKVMSFSSTSGPLGLDLNVSNQPTATFCHTSIQTLTIGARPALVSVVTGDSNGNGSIDQLVLTFDKPINTTTTSVTTGLGFAVIGPAYTIGAGSGSGSVVTLSLIEKGTPDTGVTPQLTYDPVIGNIQDTGGLTTSFTGPRTATDGAPPIVTGITQADSDGNGFINKVTITFSEKVTLGQEDIGDWKLIDADGSTNLLSGLTSGSLAITNGAGASGVGQVVFTLANASGTAGTPRFLYTSDGDGLRIQDLATTPNGMLDQTNAASPVIDVTPDQSVGPSKVILDASRSTDPNGQPLTFSWTPAVGSPALTNANTSTPFFLGTTAGFYTYTVKVSNLLAFATRDVHVTILNVPPGADAGSNQTVDEGTNPVFLVPLGSSDANGDGLTFTYTQLGGALVSGFFPAGSGVVSFTAPTPASSGPPDNILTFEVSVSDTVNTTKAITQVRVNALGAKAPTADAGPDIVAFTNTDVTLDGTRSTDPADPTGLSLSYKWTSTFPLAAPTSKTPMFRPLLPGLYVFNLTVTNAANLESFPSTVRVLVQSPSNQAPVAEAHRLQPTGEIVVGDLVVLDGAGSRDPEGKAVTYAWLQTAGPQVILAGAETQRPSFTPVRDATYTFQLIVSDGVNQSLPASVSLTVKLTTGGSTFATSIVWGANIDAFGHALLSAGSFSLDISTTDLAHTWFWYLTQTSGPAAIIDSAFGFGQLLFPGGGTTYTVKPPVAGTYTFRLAATSGINPAPTINPGVRAYADITVVVDDDVSAPQDLVPTADAGSPQSVTAGTKVTLDATGSRNKDLAPPAFAGLRPYWTQIEGPPVALSDPYASQPTFTPVGAGQYTFKLTVADATAVSPSSFVVVSVQPAGSSTPASGGSGGGCGILGMEWMLLMPLLWGAAWFRNRVRRAGA